MGRHHARRREGFPRVSGTGGNGLSDDQRRPYGGGGGEGKRADHDDRHVTGSVSGLRLAQRERRGRRREVPIHQSHGKAVRASHGELGNRG